MALRFRVLGVLIIACGVAVCYGAIELWPAEVLGTPLVSSATVVGVLRIIAAGIAAVIGVGNVIAGFAVLIFKPARE